MEADIQHLLNTELADCTDTELADWYSAGLRWVLDQHAPLTSRKVANRPSDKQESGQPSVSPLDDRQRQDGQKGTLAG